MKSGVITNIFSREATHVRISKIGRRVLDNPATAAAISLAISENKHKIFVLGETVRVGEFAISSPTHPNNQIK